MEISVETKKSLDKQAWVVAFSWNRRFSTEFFGCIWKLWEDMKGFLPACMITNSLLAINNNLKPLSYNFSKTYF